MGEIDSSWSGFALDKLIHDEDLNKLKLDFYPTKSGKIKKKDVCRAIQELLLKGELNYFSDKTKNEFSKLIEFISD